MSATRRSSARCGERAIALTDKLSGMHGPFRKWKWKRSNRFVSLNLKLAAAVFFAAVIAAGALLLCILIEGEVGARFYCSDAVVERIANERFDSLRAFITENNVSSKDKKLLKKWISTVQYTTIVIYDENGEIASYGWNAETERGATLNLTGNERDVVGTAAGEDVGPSQRAKAASLKSEEGALYQVVHFSDGDYHVYISVNNEEGWYSFMNIVSVIVTFGVFFLVILLYNKGVIDRIIRLSEEVRYVRNGDLNHEIGEPGRADEIDDLAQSVDSLRTSLIQMIGNEQAALNSNTELITSMSHDIRTPLTSLIGYLDIISSGKYQSKEELDRYIASCQERATHLKDLSDKLFNYFLVFSNQQNNMDLEDVDGGILFRQLIAEHLTETEAYGFRVDLGYDVPDGIMIRADVQAIMRVFDNLFSNIMKYANPEYPVEIKGNFLSGKIKLIFQNHISDQAKLVESTKIGVKTCKKICEDHGASFHAMEEERIYTTEILFPGRFEAEPEEEDEAGEDRPDGVRAQDGAEHPEDRREKSAGADGTQPFEEEPHGKPRLIEVNSEDPEAFFGQQPIPEEPDEPRPAGGGGAGNEEADET